MLFLFTALAHAQQVAPPAPGGQFSPSNLILLYAIIVGGFVFLIILPQRRKQKDHDRKLEALKQNDRVITNGGIFGTISRIKGNVVELKIADNVKVDILKSCISSTVEEEK
ncbi:MAG TPA: preprotein translocase subunit YajC [bacterium]|nr:preprotein translocase subunit YajC [bacterium]